MKSSPLLRLIKKYHLRLTVKSVCIFFGSIFSFHICLAETPLELSVINEPAIKDSPSKVALGKKIFFDKRLSADGAISCGSCHIPEKAFTDGRAVARGTSGKLGSRNTPSLLNVRYSSSFFWDGRRSTLEGQAVDPLINPREHGLKTTDELINLIRQDSNYLSLFHQAFNDSHPISIENITAAIAAFERTLVSIDSAFDRYLYAGDKAALSDSAVRGLALFRGRAQCTRCHIIGDRNAFFTDEDFHSLGIGFKRIESQLAASSMRVVNADATQLGRMVIEEHDIAELGRFVVTKQPRDIAKFKTPSLRNVALTAPYMHDGSVNTLDEVIDLEVYYRSTEAGRPLVLTQNEKTDLVNFLHALTGSNISR